MLYQHHCTECHYGRAEWYAPSRADERSKFLDQKGFKFHGRQTFGPDCRERAIAFGLLGASRILFDQILFPIFGHETPTSEGISVWLAIGLNLFVAERLSKSHR